MPGSELSHASATDDALVWIDCEMTGLNPDTEEILEIYCILTTGSLDIIDPEGFHAVIHWPASRLDQMDEWCTNTHGNSGLTAAVIASDTTPAQAAEGLYRYITKFVPKPRTALLAGNSVHADRAFLRKEPYGRVMEHLHYRILDVSSIKEAARRWSPQLLSRAPAKKGSHKARDDILESIDEARYYREAIFGGASGIISSPKQATNCASLMSLLDERWAFVGPGHDFDRHEATAAAPVRNWDLPSIQWDWVFSHCKTTPRRHQDDAKSTVPIEPTPARLAPPSLVQDAQSPPPAP